MAHVKRHLILMMIWEQIFCDFDRRIKFFVKFWRFMIDFSAIKNGVDMSNLIGQEFPHAKIFKAGRTLRCNPCPLCGHNDAFTFSSTHFHCFSCGADGDQVDFISRTKNLTNVEAASYLANITGFSLDSGHGNNARTISEQAPKQSAKAAPVIAKEKRDELCRLRGIAADFYHGQLLNDQTALAHQTAVRGHSREILECCHVGYTSGSLIAHVRGLGVDPRELMNIGLARQIDKTLREYIPRDCFVYPHYSGGKVLFFTFKDPTKQHKFQIPKRREMPNGEVLPFADPGWVCYGQDSLSHDGCWLCEGENDAISLLDAGEPNVTATIGAFCTPEVTKWLEKNGGGRTYFLAFDDDQAGHKYTQHYGDIILKTGGQAKIVKL